jgi:hypothetical protein
VAGRRRGSDVDPMWCAGCAETKVGRSHRQPTPKRRGRARALPRRTHAGRARATPAARHSRRRLDLAVRRDRSRLEKLTNLRITNLRIDNGGGAIRQFVNTSIRKSPSAVAIVGVRFATFRLRSSPQPPGNAERCQPHSRTLEKAPCRGRLIVAARQLTIDFRFGRRRRPGALAPLGDGHPPCDEGERFGRAHRTLLIGMHLLTVVAQPRDP